MNDLEKLDTALSAESNVNSMRGVPVGSITFAPDKANPCRDPEAVSLQAEVLRLRAGNADLIKQLNLALAHIRELERTQYVTPI